MSKEDDIKKLGKEVTEFLEANPHLTEDSAERRAHKVELYKLIAQVKEKHRLELLRIIVGYVEDDYMADLIVDVECLVDKQEMQG